MLWAILFTFTFINNAIFRTESDGRIEQLKLEIQNLKNKKEEERRKRRLVCAHLQDQKQEMKFKFAEEKAYISKASEVDVRMVQRRCQIEESNCNSSLEVFFILVLMRCCWYDEVFEQFVACYNYIILLFAVAFINYSFII